jgi:hypothetical protein
MQESGAVLEKMLDATVYLRALALEMLGQEYPALTRRKMWIALSEENEGGEQQPWRAVRIEYDQVLRCYLL